jgi:hypothetical protein
MSGLLISARDGCRLLKILFCKKYGEQYEKLRNQI